MIPKAPLASPIHLAPGDEALLIGKHFAAQDSLLVALKFCDWCRHATSVTYCRRQILAGVQYWTVACGQDARYGPQRKAVKALSAPCTFSALLDRPSVLSMCHGRHSHDCMPCCMLPHLFVRGITALLICTRHSAIPHSCETAGEISTLQLTSCAEKHMHTV